MYNNVQALLICWAKAKSQEFKVQLEGLQDIFERIYNFGCSTIQIPSEDPDDFLVEKIHTFRRQHNKENILLIVYYGGHASIKDGRLILKCLDSTLQPFASWDPLQGILIKGTKADVLIILDCCHASSAVNQSFEGQTNLAEILLATSVEGKAPLRNNYSLTYKLIQVLQRPDLYQDKFTLDWLYCCLIRYQNAHIVLVGDDADERGVTPLKVPLILSSENNRDIVLHRLIKEEEVSSEEEATHIEKTALVESPTGKNPNKDYLDAATNTESYHFLSSRSTNYVDATTNTQSERESTPLESPLGSDDKLLRRSTTQYYQKPTSNQSVLIPSGSLRTRKSVFRPVMDDSIILRETESWFRRYDTCVLQWRPDVFFNSLQDIRVKVAIISTGLNDNNTLLLHGKIEAEENFCISGDTLDRHGHGTHCAKLISRMSAGRANLYIAKITNDGGVSDVGVLRRAINHSVSVWKVDIIVLPVGFRTYNEEIALAISAANQKNVICLAATGHEGANARASFPARMPGVIPIFSSDSYGNPSLYNAPPLNGRKNFSTLGENLPVEGPGNKPQTSVSGTSYAVCIAAGMLAMMLDFARVILKVEDQDWAVLRTQQGAEKLLELMSINRGGYDYVAPWLLLSDEFFSEENADNSKAERIAVVKGQIMSALRQIR